MIRSDGVRVQRTHTHTHTHVIIHIIIPTTMIMRDRITTCGENRIKNIKKSATAGGKTASRKKNDDGRPAARRALKTVLRVRNSRPNAGTLVGPHAQHTTYII